MKYIITLVYFTFFSHSVLFAGEGMWLPQLLKLLNEKEMKSMGMKISAEDIYSINKGSLKDAIVHFGGFCTSEVISPNGLLLTNHHCGYGQIQSHSTVEHNLMKNGFWAKSYKEELPNKGLTATFIEKIDDVRYISNFSSGKMASSLATALYYLGADVTLVSSRGFENIPYEIDLKVSHSSQQMFENLKLLKS